MDVTRPDVGAPFDRWSIEVRPATDDGRVRRLLFDSPLLGRRAESLVWLPGAARPGPVPVVYHLHGTVATTLPGAARRLVDRRVDRGRPVPFVLRAPGESVVGPWTMRFDETQDRHEFLVVAPDAGAPPWCLACNWVDGRRRRGVAAESHLYDELLPVVEAVFGARPDRGGRAIIGHSMGGGGALIQAFRHPDRFAFAASSSGTMSILDDRTSRSGLRWLVYNRTQGFRPIPVDEPWYRAHNLLDLATNVVGTGMEIVVVAGDGEPTGEQRPGPATVTADEDRRMERNVRRNNDLLVPRLLDLGVPLTYVQRRGVHSIGASTFREHLLGRLNAAFRRTVEAPATFSYKAVDPRIQAWGWNVDVDRPNAEFLHLVGARTDGRAATLAGTGTARVRTPPAFEPARMYTVRLARGADGDRPPAEHAVVADAERRLAVTVDLGPARSVDERRSRLAAGRFPIPTVELAVVDRGALPPTA